MEAWFLKKFSFDRKSIEQTGDNYKSVAACYEKVAGTCHSERSEESEARVGWEGCQGAGQLRPYQLRTSGAPASLVGAQLACALAPQPTNRRPRCFAAAQHDTRGGLFYGNAVKKTPWLASLMANKKVGS